jgi:hypothetical protein
MTESVTLATANSIPIWSSDLSFPKDLEKLHF